MATIELKDKKRSGNFAFSDMQVLMNGNYIASEDNNLEGVNGSINGEHGYIGSFTAKKDEKGELLTSIFAPTEDIVEIAPVVIDCITAIKNELIK